VVYSTEQKEERIRSDLCTVKNNRTQRAGKSDIWL